MFTIVDQVTTPQGRVTVITQTRWYLFFNRPRTSVMASDKSKSGRQPGFQAVYNTSDPIILSEFHRYWADAVSTGDFQSLLVAAKNGFVHFPAELKHLEDCITGFRF